MCLHEVAAIHIEWSTAWSSESFTDRYNTTTKNKEKQFLSKSSDPMKFTSAITASQCRTYFAATHLRRLWTRFCQLSNKSPQKRFKNTSNYIWTSEVGKIRNVKIQLTPSKAPKVSFSFSKVSHPLNNTKDFISTGWNIDSTCSHDEIDFFFPLSTRTPKINW